MQLVITSPEELEKLLIKIVGSFLKSRPTNEVDENEERLNQKQAAEFLEVTEATLIRWKKLGHVPCEQLPGSSKVTYYKSQLRAARQRNSQNFNQ